MTPHFYPLICEPEHIENAEARLRAFPHLSYAWALKWADIPLRSNRITNSGQDQAVRLEYLQHKGRTQHARRQP